MELVPVLTGLLALVGALSTAYLAYRSNRLKSSGNIRTSEAADLWKEGTSIRSELRDDVRKAETRIDGLELSLKEQSTKIRSLEREENTTSLEIGRLRVEILKCEEREIALRLKLKEAGLL